MTTIVFNRQRAELCCDLQFTIANNKYTAASKILTTANFAMGLSGDVADCHLFFDDFSKLVTDPSAQFYCLTTDQSYDMQAIMVLRGSLRTFCAVSSASFGGKHRTLFVEVTDPYVAIGSGGDMALMLLYDRNGRGDTYNVIEQVSHMDAYTGSATKTFNCEKWEFYNHV
jgi:ATP-dependent protease HslVU (ClpYQ) peptidase subunit